MIDSGQPGEGKQEAKAADARITQPATTPPQQPHGGADTGGAGGNPQAPQPILVQLVGGNSVKPFEQQTLAIARETLTITRNTYRLAVFGFLAALAAAVFVGVQVGEMAYQTQIFASQTESAAASGLLEGMNTRKHVAIAQTQAKAAQDSVKAIQEQTTIARQLAQEDRRPWVGTKDFECIECVSIPMETNPNDARTPIAVENIVTNGMYVTLENSGRTPALDMDYSSFFGIVRTKSDPVPDYDSVLAESTPKAIPSEFAKQVEIVQKFTGLKSTVLPPNSIRKIKMPEQMRQSRRLNVPIPQQAVTYVVGRITYYGPERRKQLVTNFCLMNEKGVEFRFCPTGNDMK